MIEKRKKRDEMENAADGYVEDEEVKKDEL